MKKNPSRPFQVVLDIDSGSRVMRDAMNGILRFARDARDWSLGTIELGLIEAFPPGTVFDGAIVGGSWNARQRSRKALRVRRTVELCLDAGSVARLAAEHFLERGFEHYGFVENPRSLPWADERREAFRCGRHRFRARRFPPPAAFATRTISRTSSGASSAPRRRPSGKEVRADRRRGVAAPRSARRFDAGQARKADSQRPWRGAHPATGAERLLDQDQETERRRAGRTRQIE